MNKRIFNSLVIISLVTLIVSSFVTFIISYSIYKINIEKELTYITALIDNNINESRDIDKTLKDIANIDNDIRISYFSKEGMPIFDSKADINTMNNHSDREEFKGAKLYSQYKSRRFSTTLSKDTYYIALKLKNGNILRASVQMDRVWDSFFKKVPMILILLTILVICALVLSRYATKKILKPLDRYSGDIRAINLDELPEIAPFVSKISSQKNIIENQLCQIKKEKENMVTLLKNMKEGLIILDSKNTILSINKKAIEFLECRENVINKNILYATRKESILEALSKCYQGEHSSGLMGEEQIIKYYANPIYEDENITGSILLFIDETKRIKSEKIREQFSANVSHELKTPMTSIYGFAELLKNNMVQEDKKTEIIDTIHKESKRLLNLIEEIILISKLESGAKIEKEDINLGNMIEDILESFSIAINDKQISIQKNGDANINASNIMLWEALYNIIDNAIKYNKQGGKIDIDIKQDEDNVKIEVKDTGIGIDDNNLDRIFERFYTIDKSRSKKVGGSGLGLSIVKHIIKRHGGDIYAESKLGSGTSMSIILPKNER